MSLLAFDVAGNACSAAVWSGGEVVAHASEEMQRGHAVAPPSVRLRRPGGGAGSVQWRLAAGRARRAGTAAAAAYAAEVEVREAGRLDERR